MNKEFVNYEQALALKELGFNEPCFKGYISNGNFVESKKLFQNSKIKEPIEKGSCTAPLKQQAFRWLYHKLNIKDGAMPLNEEAQNTLLKELLDKLSSKHLLA